MQNENDTVVFLGPSLPVTAARAILPARYCPPARLGSVYELLGSEVSTVLIIDGVFHNEPSVWQRELAAALQAGVVLFGAASMGALRAAELHRFGMIGHGTVFEWYQQGIIEDDDEVAMLHGDAETEHRPLSEPMVNLRHTLQRAALAGVIPPSALEPITAVAKRVYYPHRSFARLFADLAADPELALHAAPLKQFTRAHHVDLKRTDATTLLQRVAELRRMGPAAVAMVAALARRDPYVVRSEHGPAVLLDAWARHGQEYRVVEHEGRGWTLRELWQLVESEHGVVSIPNLGGTGSLTLTPDARRRWRSDCATRALALEYARTLGAVAPAHHLESAETELWTAVAAQAPPGDAPLARWARACRITAPELRSRLATAALLASLTDAVPEPVARTTAGWDDAASASELAADSACGVGLYLRVFSSAAQRRACRRLALAGLLELHDHAVTPVAMDGWSALLERAIGSPAVVP